MARSRASSEKLGLRAAVRIGSWRRAQSSASFATWRATLSGMIMAPWRSAWMSGAIYDLTGSYRAAFLNGIGWNLLNMSIAFWLLLGRLRPRAAPAR